jgi:dolichyl-phosphate beta-glucosyltransferase
MPKPYLSIVIPAYNEALRIGTTLEKICRYVESHCYAWELVVVDDGSTDETARIVTDFARECSRIRLLRNEPNRGKGFSVRRGALEARGEFVLLTDADLSAPIDELDNLFKALNCDRADAAVGSRALRRELVGRHQPWFREYGGRFFNLLVRFLTGLSIRDTQCGFKLFCRISTRRAFELQCATGFGFDPELLFLIRRTGGRVIEVPVRWNNDPASKVRFLRDSTRMVLDLIALRWRTWRGTYGSVHEHGK